MSIAVWSFLASPNNLAHLRVPPGTVMDFTAAFQAVGGRPDSAPRQLYELLLQLFEVPQAPQTVEAQNALLALLPPLSATHLHDTLAICKLIYEVLFKRRAPAKRYLPLVSSFCSVLVSRSCLFSPCLQWQQLLWLVSCVFAPVGVRAALYSFSPWLRLCVGPPPGSTPG